VKENECVHYHAGKLEHSCRLCKRFKDHKCLYNGDLTQLEDIKDSLPWPSDELRVHIGQP